MQGMVEAGKDFWHNPTCSSRDTYSMLPRTMARKLLKTSNEGDSTTSLGNFFQCSVTWHSKELLPDVHTVRVYRLYTIYMVRQK